MLWGLVNGKTQTDLPWGHRPGDPPPTVWQHDLYHGDFTAYDATEIETLKKYISMSKNRFSILTKSCYILTKLKTQHIFAF